MKLLIDQALDAKLGSLNANIPNVLYSGIDEAFKSYVDRKNEKVTIPFWTYYNVGTELDETRWNRPMGSRGVRGAIAGGRTQERIPIVPVNFAYTIGVFVPRRTITRTIGGVVKPGLYDVEKDIFRWIAAESGNLNIEYAASKNLNVKIEFPPASADDSASPGLTLDKFEKGKYYQASLEIVIKGWLLYDDAAEDIRLILEEHMSYFNALYDADGEIDTDNSLLIAKIVEDDS